MDARNRVDNEEEKKAIARLNDAMGRWKMDAKCTQVNASKLVGRRVGGETREPRSSRFATAHAACQRGTAVLRSGGYSLN